MAWTPNREDLAWAAGFFDGEGTIYRDGAIVRLAVAQQDRRPLDRFQAAIGGLGNITGGDALYGRTKRPLNQLRIGRWRHVLAVVAMLWPFLSEPKREQIHRVIRPWLSAKNRPLPTWEKCDGEHRPNVRCNECHRRCEAARRQRIREGGWTS